MNFELMLAGQDIAGCHDPIPIAPQGFDGAKLAFSPGGDTMPPGPLGGRMA
ncbi:MAG: hypothetical protein JO356_07975 [Acidobacteria bacterium]|nr:hypothetical protein [Acidobacteriota bacterium]